MSGLWPDLEEGNMTRSGLFTMQMMRVECAYAVIHDAMPHHHSPNYYIALIIFIFNSYTTKFVNYSRFLQIIL